MRTTTILLAASLLAGCAAAKERAVRDAVDRIWNEGDLSVIEAAYTPELAYEIRSFVEENRALYPDFRVELRDVVVQGDRYVTLWRATGTHRDLNREVTLDGVSVRRREGGVFVEEEMFFDQKAIYDQLGFQVVPPAGARAFEGEVAHARGAETTAADTDVADGAEEPRTKATTDTAADAVGTAPEGLGLAVGANAPEATVADLDGNPTPLSALYEGDLLVVFYRGGWCPFCNFQLRGLAEAADAFAERGVRLAAISVDTVSEAAKTEAAWELPFAVFSDPDLAAHEAFAVVHQADEAEVERLSGIGIDLEAASGQDHHRFAVPSLFLLRDGVVRWRHVDSDYKVRPSVDQILAAIDAAE